MNNINENKYYQILSNPEKNKGVKIPSNISTPSCSFQLHNSIELPETNSSGNLCLIFNPFFLASNENNYNSFNSMDTSSLESLIHINKIKSFFYSTLYYNNDPNLTGYSENIYFQIINIGQSIKPIYNQYRLVSASIVIKYIKQIEINSGIIGGGIIFDKDNKASAVLEAVGNFVVGPGGELSPIESTIGINPSFGSFKKYGNFNLIRASPYHQENQLYEGIRMLYFPLDNSYYEYTKLINDSVVDIKLLNSVSNQFTVKEDIEKSDYIQNGFQFAIYVQGAPPNSNCLRCDIYCNFECLPNSKYIDYLPININENHITSQEKKEAIRYIQKKPIFKFNEK